MLDSVVPSTDSTSAYAGAMILPAVAVPILSRQMQGPDHEIASYLRQSDLVRLISASHQSEAAFVHNVQSLRLTVPASLDLRVKQQQQRQHDDGPLVAGLGSLLLRCSTLQRLTLTQAHPIPMGGKRFVLLGGASGRPCWVGSLAEGMENGGGSSLQSLEIFNALELGESRRLCAALAQGGCPRLTQLTLGHERMHVGAVDMHALAAALRRRRELGCALPLRQLSMTLAVSDENVAQGLESLCGPAGCGDDLQELRLHVVVPTTTTTQHCAQAVMASLGAALACLPCLRLIVVRTSTTQPPSTPAHQPQAELYTALLPSHQPPPPSENGGRVTQPPPPPPLCLGREYALRLSSSLSQGGAWTELRELDLQGVRLGDAEAGIVLAGMGRTHHGMGQLDSLRLQLGPGGLKSLSRVMAGGCFPRLRGLHLVLWQPEGGAQDQMQQLQGEGWGSGLVAVAQALASGARCSASLETLELSALSADLTSRATRALAWSLSVGACGGLKRLLLSGLVEHSADGVVALMESVRGGAGQALEELGLPETLVGHGRAGDLLVAALNQPGACPSLRRLSVHESLVASASREARKGLIEASQARGIQLR